MQPPKTHVVSDDILKEFNNILDWRAVAPLPDGRVLGRPSAGKRETINPIPDKRIVLLNKLLPLAGLSVLEVGCFEGIHTMGLLNFTDRVTAIDARPVNVLKTLARLSLSGRVAPVFVYDCNELDGSFGRFDIIFHFGVLYHLLRPVEHLHAISEVADTLCLDTHFAASDKATVSEEIHGERYDFARVHEHGWDDPFSGVAPSSVHLSFQSLKKAVISAGFVNFRVLNHRIERNGPRTLILASRSVDVSGFRGMPDPDI